VGNVVIEQSLSIVRDKEREALQAINLGHLNICKGSQQALQPPVD